MSEFQNNFESIYEKVKSGTKDCLYYGFAICENKVFCREGYINAQSALDHIEEVKENLDIFVGIVGGNGLEISVIAPKSELEILKGPMTPLGTKFYELQKGGICTYK